MQDQTYLPAGQVRARYGVSDMSLWRWLRDSELAFPAPIKIHKRRYWRLADLEALWPTHQSTRWSRMFFGLLIATCSSGSTRRRASPSCRQRRNRARAARLR